MADWSKPTLTSTYTNFLSETTGRDVDCAVQFSTGTPTNVPTGAIKWDGTLKRWQQWSGTAWVELTATYQLTGLTVTSFSNTGNTTLGDSSADSVTINAGTITIANTTTVGGAGSMSFGLVTTFTSSATFSGGLVSTGTSNFGGTITTGRGVSTAGCIVEIGGERTGDGASAVDFHSVSGTDYEARILRNGGANGTFELNNTGTGEMSLRQSGAGDIAIYTGATERMRFTAGGEIVPTAPMRSRSTSAATLSGTFNSDTTDILEATAQNANVTIAADTGSPSSGRKAVIRVIDNGTPRTITFTGGVTYGFRPVGVSLTASGSNWTYTTTANKEVYFGCVYNARVARWDIIAISAEA